MYIPLVTDVFAAIMKFIMTFLTNNFGLAIILFTIITKVLLFPLQLKSKKGMIDQQRIAPKMAKLEKKYKNNKQKYSEEVQKLYKEEGVSMFGGCLPMLLVLVIILGLYGVIYKPVYYMMANKDKAVVQNVALQLQSDYENGIYIQKTEDSATWMERLNQQITVSDSGVRSANTVNELNLAQALAGNTERLKALQPEYQNLFEIDFNFLGLDLGEQPSYSPINLLAILPVISAITAYLSSTLTQKLNGNSVQSDAAASAANTSKTMLYFMPIMSLVIGFTLPAGLTLYWIVNNILSGLQEPLLMYVAKKRYGVVEPEPVKGEKKKKPVIETVGTEIEPEEEPEEIEETVEEELDDEELDDEPDASEQDEEDEDDDE